MKKKKIIESAKNEIEKEYKLAYTKLHKEITDLVIAGIEKIIGKTMTRSINEKIIDKMINELKTNKIKNL